MKTGCMVMGLHKGSSEERAFTDSVVEWLRSRGRKNVFQSYFRGEDPYSVLASKFNDEGIDTFAVIPLCISEGKQTIWSMPAAIRLPDNSGSWTMVGDHDVAIRFATAMGRSPTIADGISRELGDPEEDSGVLLLAYGSELSQCVKTSEYYRDDLISRGWKAECGYTRLGAPSPAEAAKELVSGGCSSVIVLPLFTTFKGRSAEEAKRSLEDFDADIKYMSPVSELPEFMDLIDSKIPEGW